jgi:hypothetical protein
MRDTIISAIVMAAISGLTFIAYKHPKGYARMHYPVMITFGAVWVLYATYSIGYVYGFGDAASAFLKLNPSAYLHSPERESHSPTLWIFLLPVLFIGYLSFLRALPYILGLPSNNKKEHDPKDKVQKKDSDA